MSESLYMEVDLKVIKENLKSIGEVSNKLIIPVIKSNAYGIGSRRVANYLDHLGINYAAVLDMEETLELIDLDLKLEILILNSINKEDLLHLKNNKIILSINSYLDAYLIKDIDHYQKVHIQIDTGISRLGIRSVDEYLDVLDILKKNPLIDLEGIYTHFTDKPNQENQEAKFIKYLDYHPYRVVHLAASSTYKTISLGTHIRVGAEIYAQKNSQVLKIVTKPLVINKLSRGESLGYNRIYKADQDVKIAVLPIGYNNGYIRALEGFFVLANNKRYKTVARVCMNHLFVLVDDEVDLNTEFIITSNELGVIEIADYLGTIVHEVLCLFKVNDVRYYE